MHKKVNQGCNMIKRSESEKIYIQPLHSLTFEVKLKFDKNGILTKHKSDDMLPSMTSFYLRLNLVDIYRKFH